MTSVVLSFMRLTKALATERLRLGVELRGRLVEDQDRGVLVQGARDRQPLPLPPGEAGRVLAQPCFVALRKGLDELVGMRRAGRLPDLRFRGRGLAIGDVVPRRRIEKNRVLRHDRDLPAQRRECRVAQIDPVEEDGARGRVVEPGKEVDEASSSPLPRGRRSRRSLPCGW
jgi:hypothetical protein